MTLRWIHPPDLTQIQRQALLRLLAALVNQEEAKVLVPAQRTASGFWFGGGNMIEDPDGVLWLSGRYRNFGDSRTGLGAGERGLECAIFRSEDRGKSFHKALSFNKSDLSLPARAVVSIEGTALHLMLDGSVELFISSEKNVNYPAGFEEFQKPGTGVWTIDRITAPTVDALSPTTLEPVLENFVRPEYLHIKDPVVFDTPEGDTALIFCSHPFTWASSNSGLAIRRAGEAAFEINAWELVNRGAAWDVAATRITERMLIPQVGAFAGAGDVYVYFYDGAECLRKLDENPGARKRPRGYSCEELGGALIGTAGLATPLSRLSPTAPLFLSPHGTGSSRYVSTLILKEGILATWQQSQPDESQPLVGHFLPIETVERLLQPS